ncbi:unnamed protein product (macronuclear) [Paramecium tetraurelia]|uniref:Fungal lipase-like domain-containing protein n=1 Tax=Paramecium tetraurelia TaxID=5888 RepID=A0CL30_PARTE|nr:uncharacterized protein GSPATT00008044001 [Paramecium tetraurelia]CAK71497.1 unnamed protein product [Paramecium tetraurelia]|eukprot:XP_001438894.1 hypothetical protein (macronuclear) [Paramecium tetraurelia strain d4-2]
MIKQLLAIVTIGIISIAPYLDNTDRNSWFEDDTFIVSVEGKINRIRRSDPDWKPQSEFEQYHEQIYQEQERQRKEKMKELLESTANVCTNGKDPSQLSLQDYINEFIAGPCQPVILVPGIIATILQVKIDCETLQAKRPDIFENCGWQTCSASKFWLKKPNEEYRLWMGSINSPFTIAMTNKKSKCFGDFIELYYDKSKKDPKERYSAAPGISITWYGNTPLSADAECGTTAIQELSTDSIIKSSMCDTKGYHTFSDTLKNMGYIPGLTMQAAPYDFRKSIVASESQKYIKKSIETFYKLTGKTTYIFGHSLGSLHATEAIYNMTPEEKQKVAGIVTMAGPLLGATKTFKPQVGGDDSYMFKVLSIDAGINWYAQRKMSRTSSSVVDLYPKDTYFRFRTETWMQQILDRIKWDKEFLSTGKRPSRPNPLNWFPEPDQICGADFEERSNHCQLLMSDMSEHFLRVVDKLYYSTEESMIEALSENINSDALQQLLEYVQETKRVKADNLEHPGVPMVVIYAANQLTPAQFEYDKQPQPIVDSSDDFYLPDHIQKAYGDATVLASSAMTPAIKWIYEHKNGQTNIPTKLVEYCSQYSGDAVSSIYDSTDEQQQKQFTESGYLGLTCSCKYGQTGIDNCSHGCIISDALLIQFASQVLTTNWKSTISQTTATEIELKAIKEGCTNLH